MHNRVALVTGGARGIGRAIALRLAESGHLVAVNYRSSSAEAKEAVAEIESKGGEATAVQADISLSDEVERCFLEVEDRFGPVEVLINNAGVRSDGLALSLSDEAFDNVLRTNLFGTFACSRRALRKMIRARWGRIVNVASVAGLKASPGQSNYSAAKAGVIGFTRTLAAEVASRNITVNAIAPGLIATDLTTSLPPERFESLAKAAPLGRAGQPAEVAAMAAYLCSDEASFVTGSVLVADGGMTA